MEETSSVTYTPLSDSSRNIRLLKMLPRPSDGALRFPIDEHRLLKRSEDRYFGKSHGDLDYTALSYT